MGRATSQEGGAQPSPPPTEPKAKDMTMVRIEELERRVDRVAHLLERAILVLGQATRLPNADKERIYRI